MVIIAAVSADVKRSDMGAAQTSTCASLPLSAGLCSRCRLECVRDSSVTTGASAVSLNPDLVTELRWWEHAQFSHRDWLEAAEMVAFDLFQPVLRSLGGIRTAARSLYTSEQFQVETRTVLSGDPAGRYLPITLDETIPRIELLEERLAALDNRDRRT